VKTIRVVLRPDGGAWHARAREADTGDPLPVEAWGRNLREATALVRERLVGQVGDADLDLELEVDLPDDDRDRLEAARRWREEARGRVAEAQAFQADAVAATALVAAELVRGEGLTLRDAGEILGVSLQRVHQLLQLTRRLDDERVAAVRAGLEPQSREATRRSA
jgi:DNA-directed RNA polymerase specialized sigma24 family protein